MSKKFIYSAALITLLINGFCGIASDYFPDTILIKILWIISVPYLLILIIASLVKYAKGDNPEQNHPILMCIMLSLLGGAYIFFSIVVRLLASAFPATQEGQKIIVYTGVFTGISIIILGFWLLRKALKKSHGK